DTDLVSDPVDVLASFGVFFEDRFSPETPYDVVDRNHFLDGESLKFRIGVTLQKIERLDDWAMALVVRAKFQALKDLGDHAAVMALVGIADHRSQRGPIARARSLPLLDQVTQGLFA